MMMFKNIENLHLFIKEIKEKFKNIYIERENQE